MVFWCCVCSVFPHKHGRIYANSGLRIRDSGDCVSTQRLVLKVSGFLKSFMRALLLETAYTSIICGLFRRCFFFSSLDRLCSLRMYAWFICDDLLRESLYTAPFPFTLLSLGLRICKEALERNAFSAWSVESLVPLSKGKCFTFVDSLVPLCKCKAAFYVYSYGHEPFLRSWYHVWCRESLILQIHWAHVWFMQTRVNFTLSLREAGLMGWRFLGVLTRIWP